MKKHLCIVVAVLTAMMLVLVASACPVASAGPIRNIIDRNTARLERINKFLLGDEYDGIKSYLQSNFPNLNVTNNYAKNTSINTAIDGLRQKSIDILGLENYTKIKQNLTDEFPLSKLKAATTSVVGVLSLYDLLIELAIFVLAISYVLFGHNFVGDAVATIVFWLLMPIPVYLLALGESTLLFITIITSVIFGSPVFIEDLLYDFGIIGLMTIFLILLPLLCTVGVLIIPILALVITALVITTALDNAWIILNNDFEIP